MINNWREWLRLNSAISASIIGSEKTLEIEHVIPKSIGGSNKQNNVVPACHNCNYSKRSNNFKEWYHKQTFYSKERELKILQHINCCKEGEENAISIGF